MTKPLTKLLALSTLYWMTALWALTAGYHLLNATSNIAFTTGVILICAVLCTILPWAHWALRQFVRIKNAAAGVARVTRRESLPAPDQAPKTP